MIKKYKLPVWRVLTQNVVYPRSPEMLPNLPNDSSGLVYFTKNPSICSSLCLNITWDPFHQHSKTKLVVLGRNKYSCNVSRLPLVWWGIVLSHYKNWQFTFNKLKTCRHSHRASLLWWVSVILLFNLSAPLPTLKTPILMSPLVYLLLWKAGTVFALKPAGVAVTSILIFGFCSMKQI